MGRGPRKIVVGTAMHDMFRPYPGLPARLAELAGLVDRMAAEAAARYPGAGLDIAALPEGAVNGGQQGSGAEVAFPLEGPVLDAMGGAARRNRCHVVVPLYLVDDRRTRPLQQRGGAARPLGQRGRHLPQGVRGGRRRVRRTAEAGVTPGSSFPVFDCDFGRVGVQVCWDMAYDEGWDALARKGAELVVWPTQWPGRIHSAARALKGGFYVLSSTWRNNASLLDPTGHVVREIREDGVFVEQVDLEFEILAWQSSLKNGAAFDERFGERAGYRYSEEEDCGIFWSNDPRVPIREMVRSLGLETKAEEIERCRKALLPLRGGPPSAE